MMLFWDDLDFFRQNFVDYLHFTTKSKCANVLIMGGKLAK